MKKILITGATGAIGSDLVMYFSKKDFQIIAQGSNAESLDLLKKKIPSDNAGKVGFWQQNFLNQDWDWIDFSDINIVIHCAAITKVREGILQNYDKYFKVNAIATKMLAKRSLEQMVKHFIYFSTGQVFGNPPSFPISDITPKNPINIYGSTKLMGEQVVSSLGLLGLSFTIIRPFSVYGTGHYNIISIIQDKIKNNEELTVFGDGTQTRAFTHVDDICMALDLILNNPKCYGQEINLSGPKEYTVNYLIELIAEKYKKQPNIVYKEAEVNELLRNIADTSKIQNLGFKFSSTLEEFIKDELD